MKEDILLIPGTACDAAVWEYQVEHLSDIANFTVAAPFETSDIQKQMTIMLEPMPDTFLMAGHSLGGWVCQEIMKQYSHRVKKLCLLATSATLDTPEQVAARKQRIELAKQNKFDSTAKELAEAYTYNKAIEPEVAEMFRRNSVPFIFQQEAVIKRENNLPYLKNIIQPTLVIVGDKDAFFFESSTEIAKKIPNAALTVIEECGHMLTMEKPKEATALLRKWILK